MMLNRPPKTVQHLLAHGTLAELSQRSDKAEYLSALWQQAVSKELAVASRCIGHRDGILSVSVATSAWATRLRLTEQHIINFFKKTPELNIKKLDIRMDPSLFNRK